MLERLRPHASNQFGHGFIALTETIGVAYKVTDYYYPAGERTILWNDPDPGIPWPISAGKDNRIRERPKE